MAKSMGSQSDGPKQGWLGDEMKNNIIYPAMWNKVVVAGVDADKVVGVSPSLKGGATSAPIYGYEILASQNQAKMEELGITVVRAAKAKRKSKKKVRWSQAERLALHSRLNARKSKLREINQDLKAARLLYRQLAGHPAGEMIKQEIDMLKAKYSQFLAYAD